MKTTPHHPRQPLRLVAVVVVLLVMPEPGGLRTADALDVRISPRVANEPATLRITVEVEPEALNRYVVVQADSEIFSRSSLIQLDGSDSPRLHAVRYQELPAGRYVVAVRLYSSTGIRAVETREMIVVPMRGETSGR